MGDLFNVMNTISHRDRKKAAATRFGSLMAGASPVVLGAVFTAAAVPTGGWAQAVNIGGLTANNIVADGRTKTSITVKGNHTKIRTDTVSAGVGFNTFSDFQEAAGQRVDLFVPEKAGGLVNIVKNGAVVINGELNAFKDGKIGGNVFFSNSNGFIVGKSGKINVGSLTVNTPTQAFLDKVVRADGTVNNAVARQLMRGEIPMSPNGLISIAGQVNANGGITLQGHTVAINGITGPLTGKDLGQRTKFNATVNSIGMAEGGALIARGGQISIVAAGDAHVSGRVDASAESGGRGGKITVKSGGDTTVAATANLNADGAGADGAGGDIIFQAGHSLSVETGAQFSAHGAGAGAGGFVELSGKFATLGAAQLDLGSDTGPLGTLLIDPIDLVIDASQNSQLSAGGNIIVQADNSILVASGGTLDSTNGGGAAGSISIEAPKITLANGSTVTAGTTGDVTLTALQRDGGTAEIIIGQGAGAAPILRGNNITLDASSIADNASLLVAVPTATATITINSGDIDATGAFNAKAAVRANGDLSTVALPIGVVVTNASALVEIGGTSDVKADSVTLLADSAVESNIPTESLVPANSAADGAVAVSTITSSAIARIAGDAKVQATNAIDVTAKNLVTSVADATPKVAAFGASVGVSVITATTTAELAGNANVTAGSVSLDASTGTDVHVTAKAAEGGATEPSAGSQAATFLEDDKYGEEASTSEGKISVVGALAISDLTSTTSATYSPTTSATIAGALNVSSSSENNVELSADGSAVDSATGVGVAVGINIAKIKNDALIASAVSAGSIHLSALSDNPLTAKVGNAFTTTAASGAGASNVGVAGSLALNLIDTQSTAMIGAGVAVNITGAGDVSLKTEAETKSTAEAKPTGGGATGESVGIGASVALNIVANRSVAELGDGATLSGAHDVSLDASANHEVETTAEAGAEGGISLTPVVALSLVNNTTTARLGSGTALATTGAVSVSAAQDASTTTTASAEAAGSKVAIGASLALALVDDRVLATTARAVASGGKVTFSALGASVSSVESKASAQGAAAADDAGDAPAGGAPDVDSAVTGQLSAGAEKQDKAGVGDSDQQSATSDEVADGEGRSASSNGSKVSVAAGVAINVQKATVTAAVPDGVSITSAGMLALHTASNATGKAVASGAAVGVEDAEGNTPDPAKVGIGAAVAVNSVKVKNAATLGNAAHSVGGLSIAALSLDVPKLMDNSASTDTATDSYVAIATSGAGAGKVGIAGSLALNLIDTEATARIANDAGVSVTGGGDVELSADNRTKTTAEATPVGGGATGESVGIGASVALNIVANRSVAELGDGATLSGAHDVSLDASANHEVETTAEAGAEGGISLTPVVALSLVNNTTTARLGSGTALATTGAVSVSAAQDASTTTTASAEAAGSKVAIGASLALALVDDRVLATTARAVASGGKVTFSALGASSSTLEAKASAAGANEGDDADAAPSSSGDSVDKTATTQLTSATDKQDKAKVGSSEQRTASTSEAGNESGRSAKTSEGKVSAAAAVAVNVQKSSVTAVVPDDVNISASGSLDIASANNTNGSATSDGSAVKGEDGGGSKVGIGVAVSVNVVTETNTASLGRGTHSANGVNLSALQGAGDPTDTFLAKATSGAGGTKVGIAGSLALNIINVNTAATISGAAHVDATTGASTLLAAEKMSATATAAPSDTGATGGKVGIGASVGLNFITTTTAAELTDGATLTNGTGLTVDADSEIDTVTEASAGAAGGIAVDASVALAMLDERTTARVGTGNGLSMGGGAVSVSASNTGKNTATSTGENKGGKVSVGASAAVILGNGASGGALENTSLTSAVLARDVTAGSVAISAASDRTYDANATATAEGGKFDQSDEKKNAKTGGSSTTATSLDKTKDSQRDSKGKKNGSKVTVAAAAGIAAAQDNVSATLGDVTLNVSGAVSLEANNKVGMAASGSGLAANPKSNIGIGIGVGLGIINNTTSATISDGATINNPGSVLLSATSRENADGGYAAKLTALGIAGATGKKVSVAGALAVGISTGETNAIIGNNVTITNGGAVALKVDNTSHLASKALAGAVGTSGTGIGASIAVVVSEKDYTASIGSNSNIAANSLTVKALNHKIDSPTPFNFTDLDDLKAKLTTGQLLGENNYYVEAIGGSAGSKTSITGSFAVMVFSDDVLASVGSGTIDAGTGDVTIQADNQYLAKALSGAIAASGGTGVGVAGSVIVSSGTTVSQMNAKISNAGAFTNSAVAAQDIQAFGVSVAAASSNAVNGVATVITSENRVEALMGAGARVTATGAVNLTAENDFSTFSLAGGAAGGGSNGVGASASVVTVKNVTRAAMADGTGVADRAEINTDGAIEISATATESGKTIAAAGAAAGSNAVGAGAAVYVLDTTTEALIGDYAKVGNTYNTGTLDLSASDVSTLLSIGGALSGGGSTGAGAGVGVGVIAKKTHAMVGQSARLASGNIVVNAHSAENLNAITAGVGIGGSAGLAGAVAVYSVTTETTAEVGNAASLHADDNVAVLADDHTSIDMLDGAIAGGGSAGIGASVGVTVIDATTLAKIDDDAEVTALGNGAEQAYVTGYRGDFQAYGGSGGFQSADMGTQTASAGASQTGFDLLTKERKASAITKMGKGVIVNASGTSAVRSMAVAGTAAGSVAVSISASVPVITMNTQAVIGANAKINKLAGGTANTGQSVAVVAASDVYSLGFSGAVAIGGSVGGGAGVNAAVVNTTTKASAGGGTSDMAAKGDILVSAKASEDFAIWAIAGAGAGTAAIAGSGSALDLTTVTTAELGGKAVAQGNVDVLAHDQTRTGMMAGSVAIGGTAGVGAAIGVILVDKTVTASIADNANVSAFGLGARRAVYDGSGFSATTSSTGVNVEADSAQSALALVVSGAGGIYVGVSGVLALDLVNVKTSAFIGANSTITASGAATQDVNVAARDSTTSAVAAGAISVGLVGLSGAVDVGVFKNSTAAYVEDGVTINAAGDVRVSGLANKAGESTVASGSGGGFALAAGIAVYSYGDGVASGGEADKQLSDSSDGAADMDGVNSDAQKQAKNDEVFNLLKESDDDRVKQINSAAQAKRDTIDVAGAASTLAVPGGTSASVGNAVITAGGSVDVNSSDALDVSVTTGGFAVGGGAVGAGVAVLNVDTGSTAQVKGNGTGLPSITAGAVNVKALTDHALTGRSYAGAAGGIAVSADIAVVSDMSRTKAFIENQKLTVGGAIAVNADATRAIDLKGFGASLGIGSAGIGASVVTATIGGEVDAHVKDSSATAGAVTVKAASDDTATADAIAASGGLGAGLSGAATIAKIDPTVTATIDHATLIVTNAVNAFANAAAKASTSATGVAVAGGLAVGASDADSTVGKVNRDDTKVAIVNGSDITAGSITLTATTTTGGVTADAIGAAGALVGLNATVSNAKNHSSTIATVDGSTLNASGMVTVGANSTTRQTAKASGLAVGIVAAGFNKSTARSDTKTHATLNNLGSLTAGGLSINANGTDYNTVDTVAGSGGLVAGAASSGTTRADSDTKATVDGAAVLNVAGGDASLSATHRSNFAGTVDSTQASLVGGSGASLNHTVNSAVDAHLGDGVSLYAVNLTINALNKTFNDFASGGKWNVTSASGGLATLPAGGATVKITHSKTNASIGNDVKVHLMPGGGQPLSLLKMSALSDVTSKQKVKIDSGGAVALANAEIDTTVVSNTSSNLGDRAEVIVDKGDIQLNAWSEADIDNRAAATTYGLAGAPSGAVDITYTGNNSVVIGQNALLEASDGINPVDGSDPSHATIDIGAGIGGNGVDGQLNFNAILDIFNKTAIPIPAAPNPKVTANVSGTVDIKQSDTSEREGIRAAGDITITGSRGTIDAKAKGTGKDIYREALAAAASAVSNAFGGGDVTFDYHGGSTNVGGGLSRITVDGVIQTGIQRSKTLTLNYVDASCDASVSACLAADSGANITYVVTGPNPVGTEILNRMAELKSLMSEYATDPIAKAAYQSEIHFLENKLVDLGLGTFNAAGDFVPGAYAGPSPKQALLDEVEIIDGNISTVRNDMTLAADLGISGDYTDNAGYAAQSYQDADFGLTANGAAVLTVIQGLHGYNGVSGRATTSTNATTALSAGASAANTIATKNADTVSRQNTINSKVIEINAQEATLAAALIAGDAAAATAATTAIANAKAEIKTNLQQIALNNTAIKTQANTAKANAGTAKSNLDSLLNAAVAVSKSRRDTAAATYAALIATGSTATQAQKDAALAAKNTAQSNYQADLDSQHALRVASATVAADNGKLTRVDKAKSGLDSIHTALTNAVNGSIVKVTKLNSGSVAPADASTPDKSLEQFINVWNDLSTTYADKTNAAKTASSSSGTPMAYTVEINDTSARLGNISFNADVLRSTYANETTSKAYVNAPGSAKILITNNTSNTLKLNNLIIPTYDAGNVRMNGVLVYSNDDIRDLNKGGIAPNFKQVETARTSSRGEVTIKSNYNPEDSAFFDPGSSKAQIANRRLPPDIILETGAIIENTRGAVKIESAAGNIYVRGKINAGSVDILAKNGDFVSSYVNGFNHIGGDPASFSDPTDASEAGRGITANGSVSIAARYLNINSTIQSGIADWNLTLDGNPTLTALPGAVGLSQSYINGLITANKNATVPATTMDLGGGLTLSFVPVGVDPDELADVVAQYNAEVVKNPTTSPVRTLTIKGVPTQVNIKDYLSGQIDGRLEFTKAFADDYTARNGGDGVFTVVSSNPNDNIGASYDAKNQQYLVNGASVHGGYIQLFGQVMNTSDTGGKLNVLDGFGTINVTNTSDIPLVLKTLSTGEDPTGTLRGTEGKIEITDVTGVNVSVPSNPVVSVRKTVYTRVYTPGDATGTVKVAQQTGHIDNATGALIFGAGPSVSNGGDRSSSYAPDRYQRYVWTTGAKYTSTAHFKHTSTQLFGADFLTVSDIQQLTRTDGPHQTEVKRLKNGTYLSTDKTQIGNDPIDFTVNGVVIQKNPATKLNTDASVDGTALVTSTSSYIDPSKNDVQQTSSSTRKCNWWTLCIVSSVTTYYALKQEYTTITTKSLQADHPISVNFIGDNKGAINIASKGDVVLNSNLKNVAGTTTITANGTDTSIIQGSKNALLSTQIAKLTASGYVGGITAPSAPANAAGLSLSVNLTGAEAGNGYFSASAGNGNVSVISRGDIIAGRITAAGDAALDPKTTRGNVDLFSYGSIKAHDSNSLIQGWQVGLTALGGDIGEAPAYDPATWNAAQQNKLLHVNTGYTTDQGLRPFSDAPSNAVLGLTAVASGDIGIRSTGWAGNTDGSASDGTMLINQALSLGGNVTLASTGQILDNNPVETIDTRTYNQLLGYWDSLGLLADSSARDVGTGGAVHVDGITSGNNAAKQQANVTAYENVKTKQYQQYWQTRNMQADASAFDPTFEVTLATDSAQYKALTAYYTDQVKTEHPAYSDAEVKTAVEAHISGPFDPAHPDQLSYEAEQTKTYRELNDTFGDTTYDASYAYVASATERDQLTVGSVWTERELAFSIAPGALKTVTGTNPVIKDPNVSGRTVTILANKGIGETVSDGHGGQGVSIRSDLDPALLSTDQKVALAAAERTDLLLTITTSSGDVEIPLWQKYDTLTSAQKAAFDAAAAGEVSPQDTLLTVLSKRPLNFNATDKLNVNVATAAGADPRSDIGKAYLASRSGALLGAVATRGETRIKVRSDIMNAATGSTIATGNLILESSQGGIGATGTPLKLALPSGSTTTARAQNGVNLEFASGGKIDTIYSPQDIKLTAVNGDLTNANGDLLINILGTNVDLNAANGAIGAASSSLNVGVNVGGEITADARDGIMLRGPLGSKFVIAHAKSANGGTITLEGADESIIDGDVETAGPVNLVAGGRQVLTGNADVTSGADVVSVAAGSLKMLNGSAMLAAGQVVVTTAGDALVTAIKSTSALIDAVSITVGGRVFAGTLDARPYDISAMTAGAGVKIVAGLGIGDKTMTNETADENVVTDSANPLRILTNSLAATASDGSINAAALSDMILSAPTAALGGITINGAGTLDIRDASSGGSQIFTAQNDLTFTQLTTTGLPTDVGDVTVTSVNGAVTGGNIDANGSSTINGNGVTFDTLRAGRDSTIVSTGDITGNTQIANGRIDDTAGAGGGPGTINIGTLRAAELFLQATTELILPNIEAGDNVTLRSDKITAGITQVPNGPDPLHMTLTGVTDVPGTVADVTVDAPAGVVVDNLRFVDTVFDTTATRTEFKNAYVPGSLLLTSPFQTIKVDDRTPLPQYDSNVQVHEPSFSFSLTLDGVATSTTGIVVNYDETADLTDNLPSALDGISLQRDTIRKMLQADSRVIEAWGSVLLDDFDDEDLPDLSDLDGKVLVIGGVEYMVYVPATGPAVLLPIQRQSSMNE
ncbi:leukotoxin LktA family filamentous adhesin [Aquicoccus sp. G2-2]|uniref:leukotoxin LktA family filamentous adhesin n=1 Tax=Aquicoccus sp. G2-2 TaxID=3092120 RepID=UPI002AE011C9|nr:leukotoxin LktA family filamentous adhesin [Aquicoccus sp. G2-2]MEA1112282.1 leukotoxin LktA family filamentous adhesin [Aquicoccus sp. G2-2]